MSEAKDDTSGIRKNPTELLNEQAARLAAIHALQEQQQRLVQQIADSSASGAQWAAFIGRKMFPGQQQQPLNLPVRITDFNIPFLSLVGFLVKLGLAAIPAVIILWILFTVLAVVTFMALASFSSVLTALPGLPDGELEATRTRFAAGTIQYRVLGSGQVDVSYLDENGDRQEDTLFLPWTHTFDTTGESQYFSITVTARDANSEDTLECELLYNGEIIDAESGIFGIAMCSGFTD